MALLLALLLTLTLCAPGLCDDITSVRATLPDDADFRKYSFGYLAISTVQKMENVTSSTLPGKFDVDRSTEQHRIAFKPDLPGGAYELTVIDATTSKPHKLNLVVSTLTPSAIYTAVFFTGPTASVSDLLTNLGARIRLISLMQVNGSTTEGAAQVFREKTDLTLPLWQAYEWMQNKSAGSGVQLMPDRCPASPAQLCRTRLVFSAGRPSAHPASVQLGGTDNFLGFGLSWQPQTAEQMHAEACGPATCMNNGTCDTTFTGIGFRCICPSAPNIPWGPRCQHPTRSYSQDRNTPQQPFAFTRHWIGDLPHSPESLQLSIDFSGTSNRQTDETFALKSTNSPSSPLVSVSLMHRASQLIINGSLLGHKSLNFPEAHQINSGCWYSLHLLVKRDSVRAAICPKHFPMLTGNNQPLDCKNQENTLISTDFLTDFQTFWLELGRGLKGCVRSVVVNGYSVDLAAASVVSDSPDRIRSDCDSQASSCGRNLVSTSIPVSATYACGPDSLCYGRIDVQPLDCSCKCLGSKRRASETVTNSGRCRPKDACTKDPLVLSTVSDSESRWVLLPGNNELKLPSTTTASLQLEIRTRNGSVSNLLTGKMSNSTVQLTTQRLHILSGMLRLCDERSCFQFPPIKVNDGEWHAASIAIDLFFLRLTVDGVSSIHYRGNDTGFQSMNLTVAIANSNLRNIRVAGTYMSTTVNDTDRSTDGGGNYVHPILAADVTVGAVGQNLAPTCESLSCPSGEQCVRLWGWTTCECAAGQERSSEGSCVAVNPCTHYGIVCAGGGPCQQASGEPGFECLCPEGVTSRLCVTRSVSTAAPATAGMQWWIWVIVGIIALAMLVCLVFLLLLVRRRRSKAAGGSQEEIEKVHEGMGVDSEYEGVRKSSL